MEMAWLARGNLSCNRYMISDFFCRRAVSFLPRRHCGAGAERCILLPVKKKAAQEEPSAEEPLALPAPEEQASAEPGTVPQARQRLSAAAEQAATTLIDIMQTGDKEDLVRRQAANDILAINGIGATKARDDSSARIAGAAVLAAIAGMARVAGLRNVTPATFKKVLREESALADLPPELLEDQDTLR